MKQGPYALVRDRFDHVWRVAADGQSRVEIDDEIAEVDVDLLDFGGYYHLIVDAKSGALADWLDSVPEA